MLSTFGVHAPPGRLAQSRLSIWLDMGQASEFESEYVAGAFELSRDLSESVLKFT